MIQYREILRLHSQGVSQRGIAAACRCSRKTIRDLVERAKNHGIEWPFEKNVTDSGLQELLYPEKSYRTDRKLPDCDYIHREMGKSGVTLSLLWHEYCEECRTKGELPLMYSQFCRYYRKHAAITKATLRIRRKPGESLEVDWAGKTAHIIDNITGEPIPAYIFVAALSCSQYAYVEAFLSMDKESWINGHINAFRYFGGVPRILVPDNLKTGVDKATRPDPKLNRTYQEMAEHYGTAVIPARVKRPKDKPNAEGTVGVISTWIIASLRNQQFFTLRELNGAIGKKLEEFNDKPFQKKPGSRKSAFLQEEKALLLPLPASPYELATWSKASVQYDYHIFVDGNRYSVPYEYIRHQVDVRMTSRVVEVFYQSLRIASHVRVSGKQGRIVTAPDHMPEKHRKYLAMNPDAFREWAESIGPFALEVVNAVLSAHKVEKQGYRTCTSLMKLADKYSVTRFEKACQHALEYTSKPSYTTVKTILRAGREKLQDQLDSKPGPKKEAAGYGFVRGAGYYGGHHDD